MRVALIAVTIGCGAAPTTTEAPRVAPMAKPPRASYTIMPGELGDVGILEHIPHHARLARVGRMWLTDGGQLQRDVRDETLAVREVIAVLGETAKRVRVVTSDDDANLAVWIERGDVGDVIVAPAQLEDAGGNRDPIAGVWLATGTDIDANPPEHGRVQIAVRDPQLIISGWVARNQVGTVWVGAIPTIPTDAEPNPKASQLAVGTRIKLAERDDAADVAVVMEATLATVAQTRGEWSEIEIQRGGIRVHGYVRRTTVGPVTGIGHGSGRGHGYGMSDTGRVEVPAGACIYDRENGEVIGVNTKTRERFGGLARGSQWGRAYVDTQYWGVVDVYLHVAGMNGATPEWERCTAP